MPANPSNLDRPLPSAPAAAAGKEAGAGGGSASAPGALSGWLKALHERPFAFDFFRAVRLLQAGDPGRPRIGHSVVLAQDPVRFAQRPSLAFAPSTVEALDLPTPTLPARLWSRHFGLFGPNGPLPIHLTEFAHQRTAHHGDRTVTAFANIFHHRFFSFFFRAWADPRKEVDLDRPDSQKWVAFVGSLIGMATEGLEDRDAVPDRAKLYYAGRLGSQTRNAEGLEAILGDYFGLPASIETFVGRWLTLPAGDECRLGGSPATGTLGRTAIVGSRVWDCQLAFRVRLGPMALADYERLLPSGRSFRRLRDWVRFYTSDTLEWEAQLVLRQTEVPKTCLGRQGRLGWTTWLKTRPFTHDAADLILRPPKP